MTDTNLQAIADRIAELEHRRPDEILLQKIRNNLHLTTPNSPSGYIGGIDSSDNLLLNIPQHPGAAVAGYSFALVVTNPDGRTLFKRDRLAELPEDKYLEELEIAYVYNVPFRAQQRLLRISEYQLRSVLPMPRTRSPYNFEEQLPEMKVRLMAARQRELTERHAIMTALYQPELVSGVKKMSLLLKDGRLSSQNVQPSYMDEIGRSAVERGVRIIGVVKQGTMLWSLLYPYHRVTFEKESSPYWTLIPPELIVEAYHQDQVEPKTLRLGAQENRSLGGIGGAWVMYGNGPRSFYILEFNVYDLATYRDLVRSSTPLELHNKHLRGWNQGTFVAENVRNSGYRGTQLDITPKDIDELIAPTVSELHYLALGLRTPGYPLVLAEAHNTCKITQERKKRINQRLKVQLESAGFNPVDFESWSEDPHKVFER